MMRCTLWVLVLMAFLGAVAVFVPARAQFAAQPVIPKPPLAPVPSLPALPTPAATAADSFAANDTEAAIRQLQNALTTQYRALKEKGEVDAATRERLAKSLGEIFDLRQQLQQREIQMLEERLRTIKAQVDTRGKQRDAAIAAQVERILDGKATAAPPMRTTTPGSGTGPAMGGFGTPPAGAGGFNPLGTLKPEGTRFEPIPIGLPDDLIGQLLQAKNDADRALIRKSFDVRIALLQTQLTDAQTTLKRYKELAAAGAMDRDTLDRTESRVKQLMLLLEAHENFVRSIK